MKYIILLIFSLNSFAQRVINDDLTVNTVNAVSTTKASRPCPSVTEAQRNAIASPVNGACVFNTTKKTLNVYDLTSTSWKEVSGSADFSNILSNPSFEDGLVSWTNGSGSCAVTSEATTVIHGERSVSVTCSGDSLNFFQDSTLHAAQFASGIQGMASIRVKTSVAGVEVCARKAGVYTTDCVAVTNDNTWKLIRIPFILGSTSNGIGVRTAGNVTGAVIVDDAKVSSGDVLEPVPMMVGAVNAGPITITAATTNPTKGGIVVDNVTYYRRGDVALIQYRYEQNSVGGSGTGQYYFALPTGLQIDTAKMSMVGALYSRTVGSGHFTTNGDGRDVVVYANTATTFTLGYANGSNLFINSTTGSGFASSFVSIGFQVEVPILGWSSTINTYSSQCQSDIECTNEFSAKVSATGVISAPNVAGWASNATVATGTFTFPLNSSIGAPLTCTASTNRPNADATIQCRNVDTSSASSLVIRCENTSTGAGGATAFHLSCQRSTDFKPRRQIVGSFKDHVKSQGSNGADIQSVTFGAGANCGSDCTTGTCVICSRTGSRITSVTWSFAGGYNLNGIDGIKYHCTGGGYSTGSNMHTLALHNKLSSSTSFARVQMTSTTTGYNSGYTSIVCVGVE